MLNVNCMPRLVENTGDISMSTLDILLFNKQQSKEKRIKTKDMICFSNNDYNKVWKPPGWHLHGPRDIWEPRGRKCSPTFIRCHLCLRLWVKQNRYSDNKAPVPSGFWVMQTVVVMVMVQKLWEYIRGIQSGAKQQKTGAMAWSIASCRKKELGPKISSQSEQH